MLVNAVFDANQAEQGGGMASQATSGVVTATLINVTFSGNLAEEGGGIYSAENDASGRVHTVLTNCLLWGNTAAIGPQILRDAGAAWIAFSDVEGSGGSGAAWDAALGVDGGGNIDADPLFLGPATGNLRLWLGSPVVDAGDNAALSDAVGDVWVDLDGAARRVDISVVEDRGSGAAPVVDIGAYEVQAVHVYTRMAVCTDQQWFEPSTGLSAELQASGPSPGGPHDIAGAAPIWGQDDSPYASTLLTRTILLPAAAEAITGVVTFVADDGVTMTLNGQTLGAYDAMVWPPPEVRFLGPLEAGANELSARVYNRPGSAWFEACADIIYANPRRVYLPLLLRPSARVLVPGGPFQMGCADLPGEACYADERPLHTITVDSYAIDRTEVTNAEFADFLNAVGNQVEGGVTWLDAADPDVRLRYQGGRWQIDRDYENHPVSEVTWYGARAYCHWRGARLPTEAEWERAARGSADTRMFPWGNEAPTCSLLNYYHDAGATRVGAWCGPLSLEHCVGETTPVGSYPSGRSLDGLLDMAGNVEEWVGDWYASDYYAVSPSANPTGPVTGTLRVLRGGGWYSELKHVRTSVRHYTAPTNSGDTLGFRCATDVTGRQRSVAPRRGRAIWRLRLCRRLTSALYGATMESSVATGRPTGRYREVPWAHMVQ
jgi:predicted outer membrane repeat protein